MNNGVLIAHGSELRPHVPMWKCPILGAFGAGIFKLALMQLINQLHQCYSNRMGKRKVQEGRTFPQKVFLLALLYYRLSKFCSLQNKEIYCIAAAIAFAMAARFPLSTEMSRV